jgi:redox-regulated HSP33 family molecular chaperone
VANLLGEACALAALVGSALKFDGKLIVQAQGNGPVSYVVADYDTSGGLRGLLPVRRKPCGGGVGRVRAAGVAGAAGRRGVHHDGGPGGAAERYQG